MVVKGKAPRKKVAAHKASNKGTTKKTPRDLAATRARILKAAAREFALKGIEGARIDAIAAKSRANKAMIYYIFGNKDALHLAVLEALFEEKTRNLDAEILSRFPLTQDLLAMLSAYLEAFLRNPDATRMILHDLAAGTPALRQLKRTRPDLIQPFRDISDGLRSLMDSGNLRDLDPDKAVLTAMLLLMAVPVFLPHADILCEKGTDRHKSLADPEAWKAFLSEVLLRNLR